MKPSEAIARLIEYALKGADVSEQIHVFDAASDLSQYIADDDREALLKIAAQARVIATRLRDTDAAQTVFLELLDIPHDHGGQQ